jgi:hypothetical protein
MNDVERAFGTNAQIPPSTIRHEKKSPEAMEIATLMAELRYIWNHLLGISVV